MDPCTTFESRKRYNRGLSSRSCHLTGRRAKIQGANSFSNRLVALGHQAGCEENTGIHDFRREVLVKVDGRFCWTWFCVADGADSNADSGYLIAERMKFAGHTNPKTFVGLYMPRISAVGGQSSFWGRRAVHRLPRRLPGHLAPTPLQMLQSLPADMEANLEERADLTALNKKVESVGE